MEEPIRIKAGDIKIRVLGGPDERVVAQEAPGDEGPAVRTLLPRRWVEVVDDAGNKYTGEIVWDGATLFQIQIGPDTEVVLGKAHVRYVKDATPPKGREVLMGRRLS